MITSGEWDTEALVAADKRYVWHPFTAMAEWCAPEHEPLVLVRGEGALLWDSRGRQYIDGNSSIWTNIHGHNHPHINAAIRRQLDLVAHTSFLGFTNPAAIRLAEAIVRLFPPDTLGRVFFSDDGSTGVEAALRIVEQYWRLRGEKRSEFVAFRDGYHGDTAGAAALGANSMFGAAGGDWRPSVRQVRTVDELEALSPREASRIAAVVIEPLVQGAAGMKLWPKGTLSALRSWTKKTGNLLICDEVLTGFGRTGRMFACDHESVSPDIMVLGKSLTGGYVSLAITVLTEQIFRPFSEGQAPESTLCYGHSYTGNAIACAAATASLELFSGRDLLRNLQPKIALLSEHLLQLNLLPGIKEVRQCGFIAAVEIGFLDAPEHDPTTLAKEICLHARHSGLLTRPIRGNVILMPPFCITDEQMKQAVGALSRAILKVCGNDSRVAASA